MTSAAQRAPNDPLDGLEITQRRALIEAAGGPLMRRADGQWSRSFGQRGQFYANADIRVLCERGLLWPLGEHFAQISPAGYLAAQLARKHRDAVEKKFSKPRNGVPHVSVP